MKLNSKSLADVEIGFPVVTGGLYHGRFKKPEVKPNKTGDGNNLVVVVTLLDPTLVLHATGKEIPNKGQVSLTRYISLKPTDTYDPDTKVKEISVAIGKAPEDDLNLEEIEGKTCMVQISYSPEDKDERTGKTYPPRNEIERFSPQKPDDGFQPGPL